jgi:heme exporter protein D
MRIKILLLILATTLIGGLACSVLSSFLPPDSAALVVGIFIWAGVAAVCALALEALSKANDFWRALAAMWRPLALVLAGAFLLFFNDQGRELGVSLMIDDHGWHGFVFLFFALIYWALNNWHSARLGIYAALENGDLGVVPANPTPDKPNRRVVGGDERWLFWLPRLLGVCAHLFAAINLSLAAWRQPDLAPDGLFAWSAPFAIGVSTALVYVFDRHALSERTPRAQSLLARFASIVFAVLFLLVIAIFAYATSSLFLWGTFTISLSAFVFLLVVSFLARRKPLGPEASEQEREKDDRRAASARAGWTIGLFAPASVIALSVWISAPFVGRALGSMVVAYFALGAVLAAINVFEFAIAWAIARKWFGEGAKPYVVAGIVALGILNAWLHPFHRVRLCDGGGCPVPKSAAAYPHRPDDRPNVEKAAKTWYVQAKTAFAQAHRGRLDESDRVPMVIVATAGGGIRAAYWTATVLEQIKTDLGRNGLLPYLFAISGVSGGSVGATAFDAALANSDEGDEALCGEKCKSSTLFLGEDFLAPALASGIFKDVPASFLPDLWQNDRGAALEQGFEHASQGLLERPFLSLFPYDRDKAAPWRPILLLNATHEESGKRIITSHVLIERNVFVDALDGLHVLESDVRASTAAHNSARFSYISPAGNLGRRKDPDSRSWMLTDLTSWKKWLADWNGSVIDGGYFENYGALTALELARAAEATLNAEKPSAKNPHVKLVILMISSDPDLAKAHTVVRIQEPKDGKECLVSSNEREPETPAQSPNYLSVGPGQVANAWLNEFAAPLQGVQSAREAHGNRAAAELGIEVCAEFAQSAGISTGGAQMLAAVIADRGKDAYLTNSEPVKAKADKPYFAHLAMCKSDDQGDVAVQPPLGWVLSRATRTGLGHLLERCDNDAQLKEFEAALGKQSQ